MNVAFLLLISFVSVGLAKRKLSTISIDDNGRSKYFTTEDTTDNNNFTNYTHIRHLATSNNHKVTSLPGLSPEVSLNHFAGHLPVNKEGTGQLFYWFFEAEIDPDNAPLVIWLNGGPGCSSMDGLFLELGPLRLDGENKDKIRINPHSWHKVANMLFIDQPLGTGLAYTTNKNGYAGNDEIISRHFHYFLLEFFKLYPNYVTMNSNDSKSQSKTRSVFFTGESHAGHYIPCMVSYITKKNVEPDMDIVIDVKGIALGNPWMDPPTQYDVSEFVHSFGLISHEQRNRLLEQSEKCKQHLAAGRLNQQICFKLLDDVIAASTTNGAHKVLMYDIRKYVTDTGVFPPGHGDVEVYLNRDDVRTAIHAVKPSQHRYQECADPPYNALSHQDGKGVLPELQHVLNQNIRVLVFSGQYDIICNHVGVEKVLRKVDWKDREGWLTASTGIFLSSGQVAGYVKSYQNLMSMTVLNCGHMVPMDVPEVALDMISRFLRGDSFVSGFSPLGSAVHAPIDAAECGRGGVGRVVGALSTDPNKRSQPHHRSSPGTSPGNHLRHLLQTKISEISDEFDNTTLVSN